VRQEAEPLGFVEKFGYGLGDAASNLYLQFWGLFLLYYYTDVFGLAPAAVGTMFLVTKVIDAVSDPLMGIIADRTHSRFGRYRPYLLWGAIPYGLLGYAMVAGPDLSYGMRLVYAYVTYSLVMLAYTAINVPYSALMGVISPSTEERTKVTTYRFASAAAAGLIISATVTPLKNALGGSDEALGFRLTMALFAALSVLLFWVTFATTQERIRPIVKTSSVREELGDLVRNRSWLILVGGGILILCGLVTRMSSVVYYFKYYVGDDGSLVWLTFDATALFLTLGAVGQIVGVTSTEALSRRFDKHHLMIGLGFLNAASLLAFYLIPPDRFALMTGVHAFSMMTFGPMIALLFAMYTDCAEYAEWKTGNQMTGLVVSASMFSLKFGNALGAAIPGFLLTLFGFVANQEQTAETLLGIRLIVTVIPAALFVGGALPFFFYTLGRTNMTRIEEDLLTRRSAGAAPA
jgi:GPH family glycoside/pentoside/hexuronide:cation symporter